MIYDNPRPLRILTDEKCKNIFDAALKVLEQTGSMVNHEEAVKLFRDHGCRTDGNKVFISPGLVLDAIKSAPKEIALYDRNGNEAARFGPALNNLVVETPFGTMHRERYSAQKRHLTTKEDVKEAALVISDLKNIEVASGIASISECPAENAEIWETRVLLENTTKPVGMCSYSVEHFEKQMRMFSVVCGSEYDVVEKPRMAGAVCGISPLVHPPEAMEVGLAMFRKGIPTQYINTVMAGVTGPASLGGSLVVGLSQSLLGLVLSQLANKGCPYIGSAWLEPVDMRTMAMSNSGPEMERSTIASAELFRYIGLPVFTHCGGTASHVFDQQTAMDLTSQMMSAMLAGGGICTMLGNMGNGMTSALESVVMGNEILEYCRHLIAVPDTSEEALGLEDIDEIGPGGDFIATEQTLSHLRDGWVPDVSTRLSFDDFEADGRKDYGKRAEEKVNQIIAAGPKQPLDQATIRELDRIMETV